MSRVCPPGLLHHLAYRMNPLQPWHKRYDSVSDFVGVGVHGLRTCFAFHGLVGFPDVGFVVVP